MTNPTSNGVTYREVVQLINDAKEEIKEEIRTQATLARDEVRERGEEHAIVVAMLKDEIFGKGNIKGLRTDVSDLRRNYSIAHTLQIAVSAAFASVAAWWGSRQ